MREFSFILVNYPFKELQIQRAVSFVIKVFSTTTAASQQLGIIKRA